MKHSMYVKNITKLYLQRFYIKSYFLMEESMSVAEELNIYSLAKQVILLGPWIVHHKNGYVLPLMF